MAYKAGMSDQEQPEVEGHRTRFHGVSNELEIETEGHAARWNGLDQNGNTFEIPEEKILSVKWTDAEGEHEVEGHIFKHSLSDEPDTEGHILKHGLSDEPLTIKYVDERGTEQEVQGHVLKHGLSDEPEVGRQAGRYGGILSDEPEVEG